MRHTKNGRQAKLAHFDIYEDACAERNTSIDPNRSTVTAGLSEAALAPLHRSRWQTYTLKHMHEGSADMQQEIADMHQSEAKSTSLETSTLDELISDLAVMSLYKTSRYAFSRTEMSARALAHVPTFIGSKFHSSAAQCIETKRRPLQSNTNIMGNLAARDVPGCDTGKENDMPKTTLETYRHAMQLSESKQIPAKAAKHETKSLHDHQNISPRATSLSRNTSQIVEGSKELSCVYGHDYIPQIQQSQHQHHQTLKPSLHRGRPEMNAESGFGHPQTTLWLIAEELLARHLHRHMLQKFSKTVKQMRPLEHRRHAHLPHEKSPARNVQDHIGIAEQAVLGSLYAILIAYSPALH
ncbi:hypothetical protein MRB53_040210 [Persea americana]|nr:hypothetical protein MRB53_040210 [Persea americana]